MASFSLALVLPHWSIVAEEGASGKAAAEMLDPSKARIEGVVVDEAGKPVAGATVRAIYFEEYSRLPTCQSAADGTFRLTLDGPTIRYVTVLASAGGGERQGIYRLEIPYSLGISVTVRLVLRPTRHVKARVVDGKGQPVPEASVVILDAYEPVSRVETDVQGIANLRTPADAIVWYVLAAKPGVGFDYFENYRSWPPGHTSSPLPPELTLVLDGAQTVRIHAADSGGKPLPGILFIPWLVRKKGKLDDVNLGGAGILGPFVARSDGQGTATFDWVPRELKGSVSAWGWSRDFCVPERLSFGRSPPDATMTARALRKSHVSGKVTGADGRAAAGILIQANGQGKTQTGCRQHARTTNDGTYALKLDPEQSYIIGVLDEDWAAPSHTGIILHEDDSRTDIDFCLIKGTLVRGQVIGPDAKVVADKSVVLAEDGKEIPIEIRGSSEPTHEELGRWATTDKDGRYAIRVGPGTYRIFGPEQEPQKIVIRSEETIEKDFHIAKWPRGTLRGLVLEKGTDGKPVAGAAVRAWSFGSHGGGFEAIADERGQFEAERWYDPMTLYATNPEGTLAGMIEIGENDGEAKIIVGPAGSIKGRIVDENGKPVAMLVVWSGVMQPHAAITRPSAETDANGRFLLTGLAVGAQWVLGVHGEGGSGRLKETKMLKITEPTTMDLGDLVFVPSPPE